MRLREGIEQLIEDYERRIKSALILLAQEEIEVDQWHRMTGKYQAYREFVRELKGLGALE